MPPAEPGAGPQLLDGALLEIERPDPGVVAELGKKRTRRSALQDAARRDMPLHALRHTAAAAWLAAGNSLMYVQRQLGHADISTTEHHYGHLERHVPAAGAIATEEAIR